MFTHLKRFLGARARGLSILINPLSVEKIDLILKSCCSVGDLNPRELLQRCNEEEKGSKSWTYFLSASIPSCRLNNKGVIVIDDH